MRLTTLNPRWCGAGGSGVTDANGAAVPVRHGVGVICDCPCGCDQELFVPFRNPLDGGPPYEDRANRWDRVGDTFDTLTLTPSILRSHPDSCKWHGFITNGEVHL